MWSLHACHPVRADALFVYWLGSDCALLLHNSEVTFSLKVQQDLQGLSSQTECLKTKSRIGIPSILSLQVIFYFWTGCYF